VAIGLAAGLVLAALVSGRERQRQPVLPIERLTHWPVLGIMPREYETDLIRRTSLSDERLLRALELARRRQGFRTLLVTGVTNSSDITQTAVTLAQAYVRSGYSALVVDASMGVPRLHQLAGVPNQRGLADALRDDGYPPLGPLITTRQRVWIMPRGPSYAINARSLSTRQAARVFDALTHAADIVIVVGPSLDDPSTAAALAGHCQATVVAIPALLEDRDALQQAVGALGSPLIRVAGAVVTRASFPISQAFTPANSAAIDGSDRPNGAMLSPTSWAYQSTSPPQHDATPHGSSQADPGFHPHPPGGPS
jgi:Mrp family chromosome partitioning ATPase